MSRPVYGPRKKGPLPSNILSPNQLHALSVEDDSLILNDKFKPEDHDYAVSVSYAHKLTEICSDHERLIGYLDNIHNRISERESILQNDNNCANKRKEELEKKFKEVKSQKDRYERTLKEIANRRKRYEEICETSEEIRKATYDKKLKQNNAQLRLQEEQIKQNNAQLRLQGAQIQQLTADLQRRNLGNPLQMQFADEQSIQQVSLLQGRIVDNNLVIEQISAILAQLTQEIEHLELQQKQLEDEKSILTKQLKNDDETEESINLQLERITSEENELTQELEGALKEWNKTNRELYSFKTLAREFDNICRSFSHFDPARGSDSLDPHKQILNLDDILALRQNTWALKNVCTTINSSIQEFTHHLELFHRRSNSDITFVTIRPYIEKALKSIKELAGQFNQITVDRYVQELDYLLSRCLSWLGQKQNRPLVRNRRPTRRYIRYVAKALAQYLSRADQSMSGHYSDIYITFALLEERIKKNLSPSEGILIVRDYTREKHEAI